MTVKRGLLAAVVVPLSLVACGSTPSPKTPPVPPPAKPGATLTIDAVDGRPFRLYVPSTYTEARKAPLVVLLHGYTSKSAEADSYFKLAPEADKRGFLYAMPEGTKDRRDDQFWNATNACCDFYGAGTDDSGYLSRLIDAVTKSYQADAARVYLIGHSNGGFMAHRMACDHADRITAIASLAGMAPQDPAQCRPQRPVGVAQIHGTLDETISFEGGSNGSGRPYPSARDTVAMWQRLNGCAASPPPSAGPQPPAPAPLDLESGLPGAETAVTSYSAGCPRGTRVELWAMKDARHVPALAPGFASTVLDFLFTQAAP